MRLQLKQGDYFIHAHWLDPDRGNALMVCKVTRVALGGVYWRSYNGRDANGVERLGGPPMFFEIEQVDHWVAGYCADPENPPTPMPRAANGSLRSDPPRSDS